MTLLAAALALVVGVSLGLLGAGGSILTVPIFTYVLQLPAKSAIAMSLPVVGVTSLVGAIGHWRHGHVHLSSAAVFGLVTMAGAFAGAKVAIHISGQLQLLMFAVVMLGAAASMLRPPRPPAPEAAPVTPASPALLGVGAIVGVLTGILGIGGGFLLVPALVGLGHVPMHQAIGTSLLVIAMNAAAGIAGYAGHVPIDWRLVVAFTSLTILGVLAGTRLAPRVPAAVLRRAFAGVLVVIGLFLLVQNRHALGSRAAVPPVSNPAAPR